MISLSTNFIFPISIEISFVSKSFTFFNPVLGSMFKIFSPGKIDKISPNVSNFGSLVFLNETEWENLLEKSGL